MGLGTLGQGELARILGLKLEQGELVRGWGHGLYLETPFPLEPGSESGKKDKNLKLKRTKTQHLQRLLFHFILVLLCYLTLKHQKPAFKTLNFFTRAKIREGVDYMVGIHNLIYPF